MNVLGLPLRFGHYLRWPLLARWSLFASLLLVVALLGGMAGSADHAGIANLRGYLTNLAHQPLYAGVGLSFLLAWGRPACWRVLPVLLLVVFLVGLGDEWHQSTVPFRDASWWDLLSDLLGGVFGLALAVASERDGPLLQHAGLLAFIVAFGLAWNCVPSFAPAFPIPFPS